MISSITAGDEDDSPSFSGRLDLSQTAGDEDDDYLAIAKSGPQSCLFCRDTAWGWLHVLGRGIPVGQWALPRFVVTCVRCQQDLQDHLREVLISRLAADYDDAASDVMDLFERSATRQPIARTPNN